MSLIIVLLIFSMFMIVLVAILASFKKPVEKFDNNQLSIVTKRIKYLDYGLINYFSQSSQIQRIKDGDTGNNGSPYVFIYPNSIDIMCNATTMESEKVCNDISLSKSFVIDDSPIYMYENNGGSMLTSGNPNNDVSNYTMRIFNNEYRMKKRSITLNIESVEPFQSSATNNFLWYVVQIKGSISTFILSRPVFITINNLGAFKVIYDNVNKNGVESNAFISYNSNIKTNYIYLEKINDDLFYPSTTDTINDKVVNNTRNQVLSNKTPLILYYLVYEKTLPFVNFDVNSFTIHLSKHQLEGQKVIPQFISISGRSEIATSDKINTIQISKDVNNPLLYNISIVHPSITHKINLPADFVPQKFTQYDIIITYSFDILIVACFAKDSSNNEYCFVTRFSSKSNNLIFECKKNKLETQLIPLQNDVPHTSIQHLPALAFKYGYTFPN
jgi:hypothetical protein